MNKVIIFSAPSGSGKTTLVRHALEQFPNLSFSISCTTRTPRGKEKNGTDYHFLTPEEFRKKIQQNEFVEYEEVYQDKFYGTLKSEVQRIWDLGKVVVFDVDVKGGRALKNYFQDRALSIFVMPPSVEELQRRLLHRGTDDEATIRVRVAKAVEELGYRELFDTTVINIDLDKAKKETEQLIREFIES